MASQQDADPSADAPSASQATAPHVVFLANDAVFDQGLAFLESFRTSNPTLRLSMIPFANDVEKLTRISGVYDFDIPQLELKRWDDLASEFYPNAKQKYRNRLRKLAVFDIKSPVTVYLDLDVVVLKDLSFLSEKILDGTVDLICTALANDPFVYKETYRSHPQLVNSKRFSDGFFAFNPDKIDGDTAFRTIVENRGIYFDVRSDLVYSQSVTNLIVDVRGLKIGAVYSLFPNISPHVFYRSVAERDGRVSSPRDGKEVLFVHWAGPVDFAKDFEMKSLFDRYRSAALARLAAHGIAG